MYYSIFVTVIIHSYNVFSSVQQTKYRKTKTKKKDDMVQVEVVRLLLNEVINFPLHSLFVKELKTNSLLIAINYNSYTGRKHKVKAKGGDAIFSEWISR